MPKSKESEIKEGSHQMSSSSWMGSAYLEVLRAKRTTISALSRYYKGASSYDMAVEKCGFRYNSHDEWGIIGSTEEWSQAYNFFRNQEYNTKGKKVNRKHMPEGSGFTTLKFSSKSKDSEL